MRQELDRAVSLATLAPIWADVTRTHATRHYEATLQSLLPAGTWNQYQHDAERNTLTRLLRAAELAGHDVDILLREAVAVRGFGGARGGLGASLHRWRAAERAHLAEDSYRADAVRAWYRADVAANRAERAQARQETEGLSALAQEVGIRRRL